MSEEVEKNKMIKCGCGKRFQVNLWKHPKRETIKCPFCGQEHNQPKVEKIDEAKIS